MNYFEHKSMKFLNYLDERTLANTSMHTEKYIMITNYPVTKDYFGYERYHCYSETVLFKECVYIPLSC